MRNKLVLGFDSWVGGAHNFQRLYSCFKQAGFDLRLLHIGSWGGDAHRPDEEEMGGMPIRNISYYRDQKILDILKNERPCAVLFLSNDVFAHRAVNRYCQMLGIPTVHLYHGLVGIQSTENDRIYKVNLISQIFYVLSRVPKGLGKIWPLYAHALHKTHADFQDWKRFASDIVNLTMGKYISIAAPDSRANACAVYAEADVSHAMKKYGYSRDDVHIVGNPDLSKFKLTSELLGITNSTARTANDEVIYIDTGLIYAGMVFAGPHDFLAHLTELAKTLGAQGLKLAIKLHPDHHRTNFPDEVAKHGIRVIYDEDFVDSLLKCRAAMVEPSTAALIPSLLGLPVLMVAFGKLQNQKFGKVLMDYPRGALVTDDAAVISTITRIEQESKADVISWIRKNSGPLPAEKMPIRVAKVISQLVKK